MPIFRTLTLALLLTGSCWFEFAQDHSVGELAQIARDQSDPRPARRILMLGNSRMSGNDLPGMVRRIADSAHAPEKYEVLMIAPGGASFQSLSDDWRVEREVGQPWDDAVFQGESRGQSSTEQAANFMATGTNLIGSVHPRHPHPLLIINWAYDRALYTGADNPAEAKAVDQGRADHYRMIQLAHAELARRTDARAVNVGQVWEYLHATMPGVALTSDGNHPTVAASYFVALCLYTGLSGGAVGAVQWAPDGMPADEAAQIRSLVDRYRADL